MTTHPGDDATASRAPDTPPETAGPTITRDRPRSPVRGQGLVLLVVLLAVVAFGVASRSVSAPVGADADPGIFSVDRAVQAVAPLVAQPRPVGSVANAQAHATLSEQLSELGFDTATHASIGARAEGQEGVAGFTRNLVATRAGTDPSGTIVLATHIDSVPGAPGAADAGVGLAVILETVRALGPEAQRNDLVVLLVDGEERGLLGAQAFLDERGADLAVPVVVLNHEARGVSGRPMVTRAQGPMHEVLGSMPHPEFESFTDALFAIIPNDTDFTVYREGGWWGMDMAIIDDAWAYHSPQDDPAHLDRATVQHYGDMTLALTRELTGRDLSALEEQADETPVQTTAPWGIVQISPTALSVLGVLAPLVLLAAVIVLRRRGELTLLGIGFGAVITLIALPLSILAPFYLWQAAAAATPEMLSQTTREPVRAELFLLADLVVGAAVAAAAWVLARLFISRTALAAGASLVALGLLAALAVLSPALGSSMVLPAVIAAFGTLVAVLLPPPAGLVVRAVALLPTGWMLGTQISALMEFGIASAAGSLAGTAVLGLAAAAAAALFPGSAADGQRPSRRPHRLLIPVLPAVLAVGLTIGGTALTLDSPEPTQERVIAHVDGGTGETLWDVTAGTAWGAELDGSTATSDLVPPTIATTVSDDGGAALTRIVITSPRQGAQFDLSVSTGSLSDVSIDGVALDAQDGLTSLRIVGVPADQAVAVEATVPHGTQLMVVDTSYDPSIAEGWVEPGDDVSLMQPQVRIGMTTVI